MAGTHTGGREVTAAMTRATRTDSRRWRPRAVAARVAVTGLAAMLAVPASIAAASAASAGARGPLAQPSGPTLESWGDDSFGQLDNGQVGGDRVVPGPANAGGER